MNDDMPAGHDSRDDDKWNVVLNHDFVRGATVTEAPAPARKRVWPWVAAPAVLAAAAAFLVLRPTSSSSNEAVAPVSTASAPTPGASRLSTDAARPVIPLTEAFPAHVGGGTGAFTKLGAAMMKSCTESDSVGPNLAAMIAESKGCVGEEIALYKDAQNNQFNLAIFTMKDPQDTVKLVTQLTMAFDDYEVAAQAPPPGSGLRTLPADSGMVQSFTGHGRAMVVGLAQWSDGRARDYQQLVDHLEPLLKKVSENVTRYESAH
ncbi:hypothetical protein [Streptomyces herbicida]|uniref:hypothetical protein n=1 Tax=Streptomyces herbicida TaxID=3065675 RepID=UPI00293143C0|nr:hypothetical protein [Streptomyces sp. NEAU-HV9]